VQADELDPAVLNELRTLPEDLANRVARHLVTADRRLAQDDVETARAHALEAKRLAGRVACVREAAGVTAYLAGDYEDALGDLRAARRMRGSDEYLPMMADCERGLGRPDRALDLLRQVDQKSLDAAGRVEVALVVAGARSDLGQVDAALLVLRAPELRRLPAGTPRARLEYAYADLLVRADRPDEAREWLARAAASDVDGATDAAERLSGIDGSEEPDDDIVLGQEED
jgi:tetratricopeptide (TPR) repeat protein